MKIIIGLALAGLLLQSCHSSSEKKVESLPKQEDTTHQSFFPVTNYIRGQIKEIINRQVNPIKYVTINDHTDSSWLKVEELPQAFDDFLHPEIDSTNLTSLFKESSFMDQTIDAFTFTYEPKATTPDSVKLLHWDVYMDPTTEKIRRVYLLKNDGDGKTKQLTWQGDKWCKIVDIITKPDGTSVVEKEVKITWDF